MNIYQEKKDCCGCSACMNICHKNAIQMKEDEEGFLYPYIDESLCVSCNRCKSVCAIQNGYHKKAAYGVPNGYAVKHKIEKVRESSRSGGMFTALSDYILDKEGVVYGAGYAGHFAVVHKRAISREERDEFRGSKYVQSLMGDTYEKVKADLEDNKKVLFTGTACQAAGLRNYLGKHYRMLFIVDMVCHGTPSPKVWQDFLKAKEKEMHGKVTHVDFRNKRLHGWKAHYESVVIRGKEHSSRIYTNLFYQNAVLRPCCYHCKYARKRRPGDITLADFWGHKDAVPGFHKDNKGISLVLVNTKRGQDLFNVARRYVDYIDCTGYPYRHTNLRRSSKEPENRARFWEEYRKNGFLYIAKKYAHYEYTPYYIRMLRENITKVKKHLLK